MRKVLKKAEQNIPKGKTTNYLHMFRTEITNGKDAKEKLQSSGKLSVRYSVISWELENFYILVGNK